MKKNTEITVLSETIRVQRIDQDDYISLTDIAKFRNPDAPADIIKNWLRTRSKIDLLGLWEKLNNPNFKLVEFDQFRFQAGENAFVLSPKKWIETTQAIGLLSKSGRYGGTFAHRDIAFEFASWVSVEFKLYLIKEFQRLQEAEQKQLGWDVKRNLTKINYRIHFDNNPTLKLLRGNYAGFILGFFQDSFKEAGQTQIPEENWSRCWISICRRCGVRMPKRSRAMPGII